RPVHPGPSEHRLRRVRAPRPPGVLVGAGARVPRGAVGDPAVLPGPSFELRDEPLPREVRRAGPAQFVRVAETVEVKDVRIPEAQGRAFGPGVLLRLLRRPP